MVMATNKMFSDEEIIFYIKAIYKLLLSIKKEFDPDIIFMA